MAMPHLHVTEVVGPVVMDATVVETKKVDTMVTASDLGHCPISDPAFVLSGLLAEELNRSHRPMVVELNVFVA